MLSGTPQKTPEQGANALDPLGFVYQALGESMKN